MRSNFDPALKKERLRRRYRPAQVRMLFVGEAPPASGRFFYRQDSGLYRALRATFVKAFPALDSADFLASFRARGCYLVDLCAHPVDGLPSERRQKACADAEASLSRRLKQLRPKMIITVVRSIAPNVTRSKLRAGWKGVTVVLPYPGRWQHHRAAFSAALVPVLRRELR
jgi:hypothetical protein